MVHAAVVNAWGQAPTYTTIDLPQPADDQVRIKIVSAGVHALVRSRAAGQHFTVAGRSPPHVPGTDGVGKIVGTDQLVYFSSLMTPTGSLAEEVVVGKKDICPLTEGADPDMVALLTNPAQSAWMALAARAGIKQGDSFKVAIVGATGVSGQAAVQIAKVFGATDVVTIGKAGSKLEKTKELGASSVIPLAEKLEETDFSAAADVDIVLDYLWGGVAQASLKGIVSKRKNISQRLTWVQIGAVTGDSTPISAQLLRKANVALLGCGPGSWTFPEFGAQLPKMLGAIVSAGLKTEYAVKKLEDVESWWGETGGLRVLVKP